MEILCAYIRENAPASGARDFPLPEWEPLPDDASAEERQAHLDWRKTRFADRYDSNAREWAISLPGPREDIALALKVIGRRTPDQLQVEARWGPKADPEAAWVFDTPCPSLPDDPGEAPLGAEALTAFRESLSAWRKTIDGYAGYRPDLRETNLQGSNLSGVTLSGAVLYAARMEGAFLYKARLVGADLTAARMVGAVFADARMEGADLTEARMEGTVLTGARMEGADLYEARMEGAYLYRARMDPSTDLSAADFAGSALSKVDLAQVPISPEQVGTAFGDASVLLPATIPRPAHWPDWELSWDTEPTFFDEWRRWQADPAGYTPPPKPV